MTKCEICRQDRPKVPVFIRNVVGFADFEERKCKKCGRLPANNPVVKQSMKKEVMEE